MILKRKNYKLKNIPRPTISRLCKIYNLLLELERNEIASISSKEIGERLGVGSHNIRKDISYFEESGTTGYGYEIQKLKRLIAERFQLNKKRNACLVGLDSLGTSIINQRLIFDETFKIVAGFDSNINRLETMKTHIPLYPTHEISDVVKRCSIEFAVITDPGSDPYKIFERLLQGGVKAFVNFSSATFSSKRKDIFFSNIDLIGEFRYLVALLTLESENKGNTDESL